ncbi:MAG TPA: hypothetical protein VKB34_08155 [Povalibacter sp.]|nr:hypothetical protein [Povalibacter sp.]
MFNKFNQFVQRTVCMFAATMIVGGSLALGAVAAESAQCPGYTITITQLA